MWASKVLRLPGRDNRRRRLGGGGGLDGGVAAADHHRIAREVKMGFVKTAEEIARIEAVLRRPRFTGAKRAHLLFLTTEAFVAEVLPPGLAPAEKPLVAVSVGDYGSNCVGDFAGGSVAIAARHGEIEAAYVLSMYMTTDHAIVFGRELFGEPKKQAGIGLSLEGERVRGHVERLGVRLIELELTLGPDSGPTQNRAATFNIKALPAADGHGLEGDAVLTLAEFDNDLTVNRRAEGRVKLAGTVHDPLDEIPIVEVLGGGYIEGDLDARARAIATIPAADFLPYAYGRLDDWSALDTSGAAATSAAAE
ncbi:MAG: acetoacetate decarboxylase family protein [Alphaproteobacteria bacterium]|jgi:acetoacetate decarboxylase|nr:acetoacetate decarboxylase family protein [Alphaproteobacteria bacterium]